MREAHQEAQGVGRKAQGVVCRRGETEKGRNGEAGKRRKVNNESAKRIEHSARGDKHD